MWWLWSQREVGAEDSSFWPRGVLDAAWERIVLQKRYLEVLEGYWTVTGASDAYKNGTCNRSKEYHTTAGKAIKDYLKDLWNNFILVVSN